MRRIILLFYRKKKEARLGYMNQILWEKVTVIIFHKWTRLYPWKKQVICLIQVAYRKKYWLRMRSEAARKRRVEKRILKKISYHPALKKIKLPKRKSLCLAKTHNILCNNNKRLTFDTNLYPGSKYYNLTINPWHLETIVVEKTQNEQMKPTNGRELRHLKETNQLATYVKKLNNF